MLLLALLLACEPGADGGAGADAGLDADGDGVSTALDCDDADPTIGAPVARFMDWDGDGFGTARVVDEVCLGVPGWAAQAGDCDDRAAGVSPDAIERCDGVDNDCDGLVDDADADVELGDTPAFWVDLDGDGWGGEEAVVGACRIGEGLAWNGGDCDDGSADVHPGRAERCGNGVDDDCDGTSGACDFPAELDVDDAALILSAEDPATRAGASVALLDLDGDGAAELLAGASLHSTAERHEAGGVLWPVDGALSLALPGPAAEAGLGASLVAVGDLDGDGRGELLAPVPGEGDVWLLSGDPGAWADAAPARIEGPVGFGSAAAALGDLDGDGHPDIGVASASDGEDLFRVFFGGEGRWGDRHRVADAELTIAGTTGARGVGGAALACDLDGDGAAELVLGTDTSVRIFSGDVKLRGQSVTAADADAALAAVPGALACGDLDGDGLPELIIGEPSWDGGAGAVWVATGEDGALPSGLGRLAEGEHPGQRLGASLALPGDMGGDGAPDLLVGAPGHAGETGTAPGAGAIARIEAGDLTWVLAGVRPFDRVGAPGSLATGDHDGDGRVDLAAGVPGVGRVVVVLAGGL